MAKEVDFVTGTIVSAAFLNDQQEVKSALHFGVRLERPSATQIQLTPLDDGNDAVTGQSSIIIDGKPRWWNSAIVKTVSGAAGHYGIYVTAGESTTLTAANITLTTGPAPANSRQIGEVFWSGAVIEAISQTLGGVTGAMIEAGALSNGGALEWTRKTDGAWIPTIKIGTELISEANIDNGAVTSQKFKPTSGIIRQETLVSLTSSYQAITPTLKIFPEVASTLTVIGFASAISGSSSWAGQFSVKLDETADSLNVGHFGQDIGPGIQQAASIQIWQLALTAKTFHEVRLRGKRTSGTEGSVGGSESATGFLYTLAAS